MFKKIVYGFFGLVLLLYAQNQVLRFGATLHAIPVVTTANTATVYKALPNCTDTVGQHLNYATSTDVFSCGTTTSGPTTAAAIIALFTGCTGPNDLLASDGTCHQPISQFNGNGGDTTLALSTTGYLGVGSSSVQTSQSSRQFTIVNVCTMQNFYFTTDSSQPASGSLVLAFTKNSTTPGAITKTIAASGGSGTVSDLVNTIALAAGDKISLQAANNATGTSALLGAWSVGCYN